MGYFAALVVHQRNLPVISNDAITYHLPAAVQWLQTGRLGLYEAWYYNPANSYSPLGGSAFVAWLIAPLQNDSVARFVAVGPLLMLMVALLNLCRRAAGLDAGVAALVAAACVLARPFASQAILAKDDLFVAAFFVMLVDALSRQRLATHWGANRVGVALGLLLATKFTVLLSLPILLLMANRAWTLRRILVAAGVTLVIAGPWYLRNIKLTGNPLYPTDVTVAGVTILSGMMEVTRSHLLTTPTLSWRFPFLSGGAWDVFVAGYYGLTRSIAVVLIVAWLAAATCALWRRRRRRRRRAGEQVVGDEPPPPRRLGLRDPLVRTCVIGPVIGVTLFVLLAPYGEMRFAYPSVALLFACAAVALACGSGGGSGGGAERVTRSRLPWVAQSVIAAAFMLLAAFTAFRPEMSPSFAAAGAALALPGMLIALAPRRTAKRIALAVGGVATLALAGYAYVNWPAYARQADADSAVAWMDGGVYGAIGEVWQFVRTDERLAVPADGPPAPGGGGGAGGARAASGAGFGGGATIAYANTFFTYPLMGYRYEHRVVHVPTRRDVETFRDLPRLPRKLSGEEIVPAVVAELRADPDRAAWLRRLRDSGADFLVVAKYDPAAPTRKVTPPELTFAEQDPRRFVRIFDNEAGSVYRIAW